MKALYLIACILIASFLFNIPTSTIARELVEKEGPIYSKSPLVPGGTVGDNPKKLIVCGPYSRNCIPNPKPILPTPVCGPYRRNCIPPRSRAPPPPSVPAPAPPTPTAP